MKKNAMIMALLSAGLMSSIVNAAPASTTLEWRGFVGGAIDGSDITLTGQGGGDIQKGVLSVSDDGSFATERAIIVEAHAIDESGNVLDFYDGDVAWNISATNVSHAAYDVNDIVISMNGKPIEEGTPVVTNAGKHIVGFSASSPVPANVAMLTPGDTVSVTTMVFAEPSVVTP
ncbi:hypothetical protein HUO05_25860 (plasmid) [Vibrio alginolyticus]|uniref:hypothetical protein n=1 Tax=Vibrio alginolyticus TaxID=663 RepID=UPI001593C723|nr:hypothetical protein [Vibrio alginolyticus]QKS98630.1 hypothetical protein HUO05_25860 [Vibrio alginolyticus]